MSESVLHSPADVGGTGRRAALPAAIAVVLAVVLSAWGTFGDHFHAESLGEYAIVLGIIGAASVLVFGWIVPRGLRRESAAWTAVVLSVLGFVTIAVFWSGLPPILAIGGITLGWAGRNAPRGSFLCRTAVAVGLFAILGDIVIYIGDMTS